MTTNQNYKNAALDALSGNWAPAVVSSIVIFAIAYAMAGPTFASYMSLSGPAPMMTNIIFGCIGATYVGYFFIFMPLNIGITYAYNMLYVGGDNALTSNMFRLSLDGYLKNVWAMFLFNIYVMLWSLLLIVPGIVKAYSYAMTPYILKDHPELSANQAISMSQKMMKGNKFRLFKLQLSFVGWAFLTVFTAGIGMLWLMPYMMTSQASFYQELKNRY